jgi:hypothetical protein
MPKIQKQTKHKKSNTTKQGIKYSITHEYDMTKTFKRQKRFMGEKKTQFKIMGYKKKKNNKMKRQKGISKKQQTHLKQWCIKKNNTKKMDYKKLVNLKKWGI